LGVEGLGNEFLAGAAFPVDEHTGQRGCQGLYERTRAAHGFALTDQRVRRECHTVRRTD
jgi:hypothetical protein